LEVILRLDGVRAGGSIARLQVGAVAMREIALAAATIERRGQDRRARFRVASRGAGARLADGRAVEVLELAWSETPGATSYRGELALKNDFSALQPALAAIADDTRGGRSDAFGHLPFRRAATVHALFAKLGIDGAPACCEPTPGRPVPRVEPANVVAARNVPAALRPFYRHCGPCHAGPDAAPPGFLHGDLAQVEQRLARCAPRIDYRLAMWGLAPARRGKVTMPPPSFAASWEHAPPTGDLAHMHSHIARLQKSSAGKAMPDRAYEGLPACRFDAPLAAGTAASTATQEGGTR
jgi:hypothetical protein